MRVAVREISTAVAPFNAHVCAQYEAVLLLAIDVGSDGANAMARCRLPPRADKTAQMSVSIASDMTALWIHDASSPLSQNGYGCCDGKCTVTFFI